MPEGNLEGKTYQPPTGGRDLLPLDVVQKRWIEDQIRGSFSSLGVPPHHYLHGGDDGHADGGWCDRAD